jgi:hypothetical protein
LTNLVCELHDVPIDHYSPVWTNLLGIELNVTSMMLRYWELADRSEYHDAPPRTVPTAASLTPNTNKGTG